MILVVEVDGARLRLLMVEVQVNGVSGFAPTRLGPIIPHAFGPMPTKMEVLCPLNTTHRPDDRRRHVQVQGPFSTGT